MDETAIAFELPHARASATHGGPPLDRISVRDYVLNADIGAFRSEHGVLQRIRFNVVLEVAHNAAAERDDVDQVVSYDTITEAIDSALASERIDLLETLAERVARDCLADARAVRVFVRVEKLDRIPGGLGVEIVRHRLPAGAARLRTAPASETERERRRPWVVLMPGDLLASGDGASWLDAVARWEQPAVLCLEPVAAQAPADSHGRRMAGLLAIEQAAWLLADRDPRFEVVASRTELDWALKSGRSAVWAPARMMEAASGGALPGADDPAALAAWLAETLQAAGLVLPGGAGGRVLAVPVHAPVAPDALGRLG